MIQKKEDGSFVVYSDTETVKVFDGDSLVDVPKFLWQGTKEEIQKIISNATSNIAFQQTIIDKFTPIQNEILSV